MNYSAKQLAKMDALKLFPQLIPPHMLEEVKAETRKRKERQAKKKGLKLVKTQDWEETDSGILYPVEVEVEVPAAYDENGPEFDIVKFMQDTEDPVTGTLRDLRIDDRDLYAAKNYWDFAFNVIGKDAHPPWAKQMWTGLMLFGEVCPCCSNPKWLNIHNVDKRFPSKDIQEHLTLLEYGKCPKCKRGKWELIQHHGLRNYQQLSNVLGQRSGKSSSAASYEAYLTHRYLKFPNLATMTTQMQASTELTATFVSLTFAKAVGVLWTPYKNIIETSQWFKDYRAMLDHYGEKQGRELYKLNQVFHTYAHKNLKFYPSGPKSSTLRGDTRVSGILDELGLFPLPKGDAEEDENSERANADEAHKSLTNSLVTVQGVCLELMKNGQDFAPPALMLCVSSPISLRDKVMRLYRESQTEAGKQFILGVNLPTWDVNPGIDRDHPTIVMAYNSNHEKAERDFGANPPQVHSTFIPKKIVESGVFVGPRNTHTATYKYDKPGELYATLQRHLSSDWPSIVTLDAGLVNNSFVVTGGHYNFDTGKTVVTSVIEVMPHDGRRINFNLVYEHVILPLCKELKAVACIADRWNSVDILNRVERDMGNNELGKPACKTKQFTPRRRHFDTVVSMLEQRNVICPALSDQDQSLVFEKGVEDYRSEMAGKPVAHLALQMITVRDMGENRCPDKGEGYTDDIFRAFVLCVALIHEPKIMERLNEARKFKGSNGHKAMPMPIYKSRGYF